MAEVAGHYQGHDNHKDRHKDRHRDRHRDRHKGLKMAYTESKQNAQDAAQAIADDILGRSGLGNEWHQIDRQTQEEILESWTELILNATKG